MVDVLLKTELENLPKFQSLVKYIKLPSFSQKVKSMLSLWFKRIEKCFKQWEKHERKIISSLVEKPSSIGEVDNFIPEELRQQIREKCKKNIVVKMNFPIPGTQENRTFFIHICLMNKHTYDNIYNMIQLIYVWLCFVNDFVEKRCSTTVDIYIYMIPEKKDLPEENKTIDTEDINTAFTTTCQVKTTVTIFREEEWFRALIHESFHNLGLDFIRMDHSQLKEQEDMIRNTFFVNISDIRLYETYCEMWAETLNLMFYSFIKDPLRKDSLFSKLLIYERTFALWQCSKLLNHSGIKYDELFIKEKAKKYSEKTQGFSYFVLKSILSVHFDQFLEFCANQFSGNRVTLAFKRDYKNLQKYTKLFLYNAKSKNMLVGTAYMNSMLKIIKSKKKKGTFIKTLRMSLFEIEI